MKDKKAVFICIDIRLQTLIIFAGAALFMAQTAVALPTLQLNMPDGDYHQEIDINGNTITESWFTQNNPFELQVVGAPSPNAVHTITDVRLWIAIQTDDFEGGGTVTVQGTDLDNAGVINPVGPVNFGRPGTLSPHGIYDAYYFEYQLGDLYVGDGTDPIWNYNDSYDHENPGAPVGTGDVQNYEVSYTGFFWLHIDLTGTALDEDGNEIQHAYRFAPYSHDADAPGPVATVPEPATMFLFAAGLGMFAFARRRKFILVRADQA